MKGTSKQYVFLKRASGWCELVKTAAESVLELLAEHESKPYRGPTVYSGNEVGDFISPTRVATRVQSRPLIKGTSIFYFDKIFWR